MKKKFDFVRIYDEPSGFKKPYDNIEFVVSSNFFKQMAEILKYSSKSAVSPSKHQDGRAVYCPQNYDEFKKYLAQTKIDDKVGDIRVVYHEKAPLLAQNLDGNNVTIYYGQELADGYQTLLECAKELLYDGKQRPEKTEKHLKRMFVCESNKIHKELLNEYYKKNNMQTDGLYVLEDYDSTFIK